MAPRLQKLAEDGDPEAFAFPTAQQVAGLDFSFSGLKTALLYKLRELGEDEARRSRADLAASYQRAIVETLARRVERALEQTGVQRLALGGGVAANGPLRERMRGLGVEIDVPPIKLCTDNAAMIASAARHLPALPFPRLRRARRLRDGRAGAVASHAVARASTSSTIVRSGAERAARAAASSASRSRS